MLNLSVQVRDSKGKKVKNLRREGIIPAELYGHGFPNLHLSVKDREFAKVYKEAGESSIIALDLKNEGDNEKINVLIYDVLRNALTDKITHVDFYRVRMDEKITAPIPLKFIGEAPAQREQGAVIIKSMQEIEVEALPMDLPHSFDVDLNRLINIGDSLYVKDLGVPKGVKFLIDAETVIATAIQPAKEEVEEKPMTVEDVKVEGEEKKEKTAEGEKAGEEVREKT